MILLCETCSKDVLSKIIFRGAIAKKPEIRLKSYLYMYIYIYFLNPINTYIPVLRFSIT